MMMSLYPVVGELGLLSRGTHSRTIVAAVNSKVAMLSRQTLDEIDEVDKVGEVP
jgi:CRP-like cAMP-binding protein